MMRLIITSLMAGMILNSCSAQSDRTDPDFTAEVIARYETGIKNASATEVIVFDPVNQYLFSTNSSNRTIDVISIKDAHNPSLLFSIDLKPFGNKANSISFYNNVLAVAVEDTFPQRPGRVVFFDAKGKYHYQVPVGHMPDMLTFTPDGKTVIVANEGEPTENYSIDPEGSVSVIDLHNGIEKASVRTISFNSLTGQPGMKIMPGVKTLAMDLEPEYITVSPDSKNAWVVMQENNAILQIDLATATIANFWGLGFKDHNLNSNEFDASDKTIDVDLRNWPVSGMYQPDAIASFTLENQLYLITANEGDKRDYNISEGKRVNSMKLDSIAFPEQERIKHESNLGRLLVSNQMGDTDGDGDFDQLYSFGARSFSIWDTKGNLVFDSGSEFEKIISDHYLSDPELKKRFKKRADDKGPEPEGLAIANIKNEIYVFIGLERMGGVMVYKIKSAASPEFVTYLQGNDFAGLPDEPNEVSDEIEYDLNPEGLLYIAPEKSPNGKSLLVVANEVSGTITIYSLLVN